MFGSPKGRTELIIGGSGAKNCAEHHGNVRFGVAPQKPTKNCKKTICKSNFFLFGEARGSAGVGARAGGRRDCDAAAAASRSRRRKNWGYYYSEVTLIPQRHFMSTRKRWQA